MVSKIQNLGLVISAAIVLTACSTLNPKEIRNLNRIAFAPLELSASVEPTDLRLDVIRQQTQYYIGDNLQTMDVPNDPLGFDLGNGLFYDLNQNFSLRLDKLLGYESEEPFALRRTDDPTPSRGFTTHTFRNDSLTTSYSERNRIRYKYHRVGSPDSVSYMNGDALRYAIARRDSSLACRNRRKVKREVFNSGAGRFTLETGRRETDFVRTEKGVELQSRYLVDLSNANKMLTIYRLNRKGSKTPVYNIIRSREAIYVFNEKFRGRKIVFENSGITVFHNDQREAMYALVPADTTIVDRTSAMR